VFDRPAELTTDTLYVAGGLYGNLAALDEIERLSARENAQVVFNGDFHWFDAEPLWFAEITRRVAKHHAIRGNVETELARGSDIGAGCGCAYPASVDEDIVRRSNDILFELRETAAKLSGAATALRALPMHLVAHVGDLRIGIVHGDATALAGWSFAHDALDQADTPAKLDATRRQSQIDVFASAHTCLAALRDFKVPAGRTTVVNNGAAGMPNFAGNLAGLVTRIGRTPSPHATMYGIERDGVHIDAIPVPYDHDRFLQRFLARWETGSAAHVSYFGRIVSGPSFNAAQARPIASE
jgi:predicted phosphodiesterase